MQYGLGVLYIKEKQRAFENDKYEEEEAVEIRLGQPVQQNRALWVFSLSCTKNATRISALVPVFSLALSLLFHPPLLKKSKQEHQLFHNSSTFYCGRRQEIKSRGGDWTWGKKSRDRENCSSELTFRCCSLEQEQQRHQEMFDRSPSAGGVTDLLKFLSTLLLMLFRFVQFNLFTFMVVLEPCSFHYRPSLHFLGSIKGT